MSKHQKWFSVLLLLLVLLLGACAGGGTESDHQGEGQTNGGNKDLVLAVHSDASTLDPAGSDDIPSHNMQQGIYEGLVKRDKDNQLIPGLAKEWHAIDELTYEFILQEDVKFHDGEAFNAEAVKTNIERLLDPEVASSKYNKFEMITEVEAVDEYTVRIKTAYPFAPLIANFSHMGGSMISPKAIEADYAAIENGQRPGTAISENPIGTGHFKFESRIPGEELKLVRNDEYWGDKALVEAITFKVIPESGTRNADLERGFVHIVDPVLPSEVSGLKDSDFATILQVPSTTLSFIGFNLSKAPFDDINVRKAISMMIDKQEIIDGVHEGFGIVADGPIAPKVFGYSEDIKGIDQDVEEAKRLMKEAGYEDGFKATIWTNDGQQRVDTAILLQNVLKEINIDLSIEQMEFGTYIERLKAGEHDLYVLGWTNPLAEPDLALYSLFHSSSEGIPPNAMWYKSDIVDDLLDRGRQATDEEERLAIYKQAQEQIIDDAPMIFLDYKEYLMGVSDKITGFSIDSSGIYQLDKVEFVE